MDLDPSLLLALRGKSIEDIAAMTHRRWTSNRHAERTGDAATEMPTDDTDAPNLASFYQAGPALEQFSVAPRALGETAALLYSIGKPPFAGENEDPLTPLAHVYEVMTEQALSALDRVRRTDENRRNR